MNTINNTFPKIPFLLQRVALVLFGILPIGLSLLSQLGFLFDNWTIFLLVRMGLFVRLFLLSLIAIVFKDDFWNSMEGREYIPLLWVIILSIALRLIVLPLLSTNFTSDFEDIHNFARDVVSGNPYANLENYPSIPWATHLNMTGLATSVVYGIFGVGFSTAKMFMLVLSALTVWLIYLAGKELAGARVGFISSSLYGTLPSLICYTGVLTGEHFALPLATLAILLYARLKRSEDRRPLHYATGYVFCGAALGLMDWFRPGGIILLVAFIITELIYLSKDKISSRNLISLALLIICYVAVSNLAVTISEVFFRTDVMSTLQKRGYFILVGMNSASQGRINLEDRRIALEAYERFKDDNFAANNYLIQLAVDRLKGESVLNLFRSKFILIWSNHEQLFQISLNGSNDQEAVKVMSDMDSLIYLLVTIFVGINVFSSFLRRTQPEVLVMQLFILGFAIWALVLEAQNRYVIITLPYLMLLGSMGVKDLMDFIGRIKNQNPHTINVQYAGKRPS